MDTIVAQYMGFSLGLGQLLTIITQIVKTTEKIPFLSKIPGVQFITDKIARGNPVQVRTFVGVLAAVINITVSYLQTGEAVSPLAIMGTVGSFVSAIGGYDLWFSGDKKKPE